MKNFEYAKARSVDGAIQLSTSESRFLSGGIDLLGEMKEYIVSPKRVIDLKTIPDLDRIDTSADTWKFGANVRIAEIARNDQDPCNATRVSRGSRGSRFAANSECCDPGREPGSAFAMLVLPTPRSSLSEAWWEHVLCSRRREQVS